MSLIVRTGESGPSIFVGGSSVSRSCFEFGRERAAFLSQSSQGIGAGQWGGRNCREESKEPFFSGEDHVKLQIRSLSVALVALAVGHVASAQPGEIERSPMRYRPKFT